MFCLSFSYIFGLGPVLFSFDYLASGGYFQKEKRDLGCCINILRTEGPLMVSFQRCICLPHQKQNNDGESGRAFSFKEKRFFMHSSLTLLYMASRENTFSFIKLATSLNRLSMAHNSEGIRIYSEK